MTIPILATTVCACWWIAEFTRESVQDRGVSREKDKSSSILWDLSHLITIVGVIVGFRSNKLTLSSTGAIQTAGFAIMLIGILIRWIAIHELGKYFTGRVTIRTDHHLVKNGPYKWARHPAYTGSLVANFGFGMVFKNWISFILIFVPILLAALYRMEIEEKVLNETFGSEYADYAARVKRLVPGIY